ncbi:hypothetical protein NFI96_012125, partial [Prochilodus magdalenae]
MGFSCRIPCVKPLLNKRQCQKRLNWAKDKKDWTAAEWSKVNAAIYQEVLENFMPPAALQLYEDADFIFQQDLAPAHSAKATSTWFKDH